MKIALLIAIGLAAAGCFTSPTSPDCTTLPKVESKTTTTVNGRLLFISVTAPKTTVCE